MGLDKRQQMEIWARKIKASDEAAFSALFHRLYPRLVKFSWRYTKTKTSAKDIVQDSFIKLWEVRSGIDPQQSLQSYLFQIVRNKSLNYLRDHSKRTINLDDIPGQSSESDLKTTPEAENNTLGKAMQHWINALPERQQEAIKLSRFEGLNHEEIAYVMNISPRTVNNHIVKALGTLRDEWNAYKTNNRGSNYD